MFYGSAVCTSNMILYSSQSKFMEYDDKRGVEVYSYGSIHVSQWTNCHFWDVAAASSYSNQRSKLMIIIIVIIVVVMIVCTFDLPICGAIF